MSKRSIMVLFMAIAVFFAVSVPALAASSQNYSIVLPSMGQDYFTSSKTVSAYKDFGVYHRYSGGKTIHFTVCDTAHNPLGAEVAIAPGGSSAPLVDLWYNSSSSSRTIVVKMETPWNCFVSVLAEGTWYWNY